MTFYFRGECADFEALRPAVMRRSPAADEGEMLLDLRSRRPEDFVGMNSALAHWVLAQHHGLETRLLDVTRNPLVGLFNACRSAEVPDSHTDEDGRLHIFAVPNASRYPRRISVW